MHSARVYLAQNKNNPKSFRSQELFLRKERQPLRRQKLREAHKLDSCGKKWQWKARVQLWVVMTISLSVK